MLINLWNDWLYQPLFNSLIWIYNNWTDMNFGWAVVYLTIMLRVVLLPFTLIDERNRVRNTELLTDVMRINKEYPSDLVARKEEIRRVLKKRRVQPWAKAIVLGIQVLVLILLYQVFLRGITGDKILKILYPWVQFPGAINLDFYGFDLGRRHDIIWSGLVAVWLLIEIYFDHRKKKNFGVKKADLTYFVLFPAFVFFLLWYLPMVKSLFILTSMAFSLLIGLVSKLIFGSHKPAISAEHH